MSIRLEAVNADALDHTSELKFDFRTQRCLTFKSIQHLEQLLTKELTMLKEA